MQPNNEIERAFEARLQGWAERQRLPDSQVEGIRQAILREPPQEAIELSTQWWHRVSGALDTVLWHSTMLTRYRKTPSG